MQNGNVESWPGAGKSTPIATVYGQTPKGLELLCVATFGTCMVVGTSSHGTSSLEQGWLFTSPRDRGRGGVGAVPDPNHLLVSVQAPMGVRGGWQWWNARFPSHSFLAMSLLPQQRWAAVMGLAGGVGQGIRGVGTREEVGRGREAGLCRK